MQMCEFYPSSSEPTAVLILPNHLGSTIESDFSARAQQLSESLGMLVLAYERPGSGERQAGHDLPRKIEPSKYINLAAQTGKAIDTRLDAQIGLRGIPRVLSGNSAAATDVIMVARSQTLQADYLIAADPVAIQEMSRLEFRSRWLEHQRAESRLKSKLPSQEASENHDANSGVVGKALLGRRFLRDLNLYEPIWRSNIAYTALHDIAESGDFSDLAANISFVEHTFSGTPEFMLTLVNELNSRQRSGGAAKFKATYMPATYHSQFNNAQTYAAFISHALAEITPSSSTVA